MALHGDATFAPYIRISWVHEFKPDRRTDAYFNSVPGAAFTVEGPRVASNSAKVDLGMNVALGQYLSLFGNFDSEISSRSFSYAGRGGLKVFW